MENNTGKILLSRNRGGNMDTWKRWAVVGMTAVGLWVPLTAQAVEEIGVEPKETTSSEIKTDTSRSDDWFSKQDNSSSEKGALGRAMERKRQETGQDTDQQSDKKVRYIYLFEDNGFVYYLDNQNVKWKPIPYSETEEILDIWIKLIKVAPDEEYSYPQKYFLEHYYLRPDRKQIQFLSELEVTGRPDNAIKERPYSVHNWENIVSGSLEDEIYHSVLKVVKKNEQFWPKHKSVRDVLEDIFRISL